MTINLADNNPRISYSVAQGATQQTFAVPFEFFNDSDLSIYVDGVLKTEGTHYTITGGDGSTGNVVFVTATPPAVQQVLGATGGSTVVITRTTPIERTSDFSAGADINRAALNEQLDILTAMIADAKDRSDRSISLNGYDAGATLTLPVDRAGKVIAFDEDGDLVNGPTVSAIDTVSNASADIQTVADNIAVILDAEDQATAAASSASAAASSASAAAGSASAAASSASTASASADAALAALDSFDDRYLGAKSSDPSVDNDGNALLTGAVYFNTTSQVMRIYTGSVWRDTFTLTSDVQEFSSSGTWTKPTNAKLVVVELWAGGGGGGSGRRGATATDRLGGTGGGGGGFHTRVYRESELTSTVSVTIGAGGAGGAAIAVDSTSGAAGTVGGNSSFGSYAVAFGGGGGPGGIAGTTGSSSFGGQNSVVFALPSSTGGNGGTSRTVGGGQRPAGTLLGSLSPLGGGAGGAISSANAAVNAGLGGFYATISADIGPALGDGVGAGVSGAAGSGLGLGGGGGGVGSAAAAGAGGAGGTAAGGGGGGCSLNGFNSGAGGAGGNGYCRVTTYY